MALSAKQTKNAPVRLSVELPEELYVAIRQLLAETGTSLTINEILEKLQSDWNTAIAEAASKSTAAFDPEQGKAVIELRIVQRAPEIDPDQAYFWREEWQAKEREIDEHLAAGRYEDFSSMEDFLADLQSDE